MKEERHYRFFSNHYISKDNVLRARQIKMPTNDA
jgi:hypothetical protein